MPKYKVYWEVSKYAFVEAKNSEEAVEKIMSGDDIEQFENEITAHPEAIETE